MRQLTEQELLSHFDEALQDGQICAYYQPKFNHSTGRLVGAEALMRWKHPEHGLQSPVNFIPVFEKYGLIARADLCVFEHVCKFLSSLEPAVRVPVSFNISRYDLLQHGFIDDVETIRKKYDIPVALLRVEITESSAMGGVSLVSLAIDKFHQLGYMVAMDDFGSGYSSLSLLKNLPVDILKLDLRFLSDADKNGRAGIILNSAVQMAKWLETHIIAEGVETLEQADFLKSIGCNYIQGYLYSKPLHEADFRNILQTHVHDIAVPVLSFMKGIDVKRFWNLDSFESSMFNHFVGAACIFTIKDGAMHLMRVNKKYIAEIGIPLTEDDVLAFKPFEQLDEHNRQVYLDAVQQAIDTGEEVTCETWRNYQNGCCGIEHICIRSSIQLIAKSGTQTVFYVIIQNVTREKERYEELLATERKFRYATEQANMYAWEYIVDTKEMHPCFRCMRDLHLPPVVKNYPEPAIEAGIFPPDYADMYRDWHKQIASGVKSLEAVIPLTVGRIPFKVRYTTEFDENGRPFKAYGSATLLEQPVESVPVAHA